MTRMRDKKKRLLYFMSVDWNWIAQRPHFLALELEKKYEVTVIYPRFLFQNWKKQQKTERPVNCLGVWQIPFQERNSILRFFGNGFFHAAIGDIHKYDCVWFGTPLYYRLLPADYNGYVIYDYMDDIVALQGSASVADYTRKMHKRLLERADAVFATSSHLKNSLPDHMQKKTYLVRNAYNGKCRIHSQKGKPEKVYRFGYIGTISSWMDFPLLMKALEAFKEIEFHFWGPAAVPLPAHPRLFFHDVVEHDELAECVRETDCLIMPFQLMPIVLAVDPVKLYEYISFGKPILCVEYPEIERFRPYVWFYHDKEEFFRLIRKLTEGLCDVKYTEQEQIDFLAVNSWAYRCEEIEKILDEGMNR